jgi:para-aminobenzoate synthetase component I
MGDDLNAILGSGRALDWRGTPDQVLARLPVGCQPRLLNSGRYHERWATRSILGFPAAEYTFDPPMPEKGKKGEPPHHRDPFDDIQRLLDGTRGQGIWIGWISYDVIRFIEELPELPKHRRTWPVVSLAHCPDVAVWDLKTQTWTWHGDGKPPELAADLKLTGGEDAALRLTRGLMPTIPREEYLDAVRKVIDYIGAGDIFQANYAQRFSTRVAGAWPAGPRGLYARLCKASPAWYGAYLETHDQRAILSSSPELFLELDRSGLVITRPIKGTRPASEPAENLRKSEKDTAELNMIVDLLRNDLGRVARYGSVKVTQPREIESHPTVHHGVATIQARLRPGTTVTGLLKATMPGGSITGAPKIRAMQIIDELEPVQRGPYCGAIGWMTADAMCLNIAIRTMLTGAHGDDEFDVDFSVGGGIVADSTPESEYQETIDKAQGMLRALGIKL